VIQRASVFFSKYVDLSRKDIFQQNSNESERTPFRILMSSSTSMNIARKSQFNFGYFLVLFLSILKLVQRLSFGNFRLNPPVEYKKITF